jgi:uncharacterized membrane protein YkoI
MKTSTNLIVIGSLLGTLGLAGVARFVHATQPQPSIAIMPEHRNGSLMTKASDGDKETNDDAKGKAADREESAKLRSLAKITAQQAQQAAESSQGGQAKGVKLENENGNLVYAVEIGNQEVTVDAGNGKILSTEMTNQKNGANEENHPRSSIQVSEALGGDGDGETNDDG